MNNTYSFKKTAHVELKNEYKGIVDSVEVAKKRDGTEIAGQDKNGNPYAVLQFNFLYDDGTDEGRKQNARVMLPYSLDGESVGDQILALYKLSWKDLKEGGSLDIDPSKMAGKDCVIHIGAARADQDYGDDVEGEVKTYRDQEGKVKLSREIIGVHPLAAFGKSWTDRHQATQDQLYKEFKAKTGEGQETATAEDMSFGKEFKTEEKPNTQF